MPIARGIPFFRVTKDREDLEGWLSSLCARSFFGVRISEAHRACACYICLRDVTYVTRKYLSDTTIGPVGGRTRAMCIPICITRVYARAARACVCELTSPTADAAGIVCGAVGPRFKYWLTQVGSKRARERGCTGALGDRLRTPRCSQSRSPHSGGRPRRSGKVSSQQ